MSKRKDDLLIGGGVEPESEGLVIKVVTVPEGLPVDTHRAPPTGEEGSPGVVTSQRPIKEADVVEEVGTEPNPFWTLLVQVGYEPW